MDVFLKIRELYDQGETKTEILKALEKMPPPGMIDTAPVYSEKPPPRRPDETRIINVIEKNTEVIKTTQTFTRFLMEKYQDKMEDQEEQIQELKDQLQQKDQEMEDRILIKVNDYLADIMQDWKK